jgi:hypothetical protein
VVAPTLSFLRALVEKFEQKKPIKTLFLVEGYFKAFKAAMCGMDIIGLSSITHMKDKDKGNLHEDILKLDANLQCGAYGLAHRWRLPGHYPKRT